MNSVMIFQTDSASDLKSITSNPTSPSAMPDGRIAAHLHFGGCGRVAAESDLEPRCVVIQALAPTDDPEARDGGWPLRPFSQQALKGFLCVARHEAVGRVDESVFVRVGEIGQDGERVSFRFIPSVIRLQPLDECLVLAAEQGNPALRHALKLPLGTGCDGELSVVTDPIGISVGGQVQERHLAGKMVQGGPKVMDTITEKDAKADREVLPNVEALDPLPGVVIEFADGGVGLRVGVDEAVQLRSEYVELLFGPVELFDHPG